MNSKASFLAAACILTSITAGYLVGPFVALQSFKSPLVSRVSNDEPRIASGRDHEVEVNLHPPDQVGPFEIVPVVAVDGRIDRTAPNATQLSAKDTKSLKPPDTQALAVVSNRTRHTSTSSHCYQIVRTSTASVQDEPLWRCIIMPPRG